MQALFNTENLLEMWDPTSVLYLIVVIIIIGVAKKVNDFMTPYDLKSELTEMDNKAIAVCFSAYLFSIGIILSGVLTSEASIDTSIASKKDLIQDLCNTALWGVISIALLELARFINDKFLLSEFSIAKELATDQNVGTGAVQAGSFIGSALMIRTIVSGEDTQSLIHTIILAVVYFLAAQISFIIFSKIYQFTTAFCLHDEIEKDNAAAGVSFGMTLTAVGLLLAGYLSKYDSLIGLFLWFIFCSFSLLACRVIIDKLILPGNCLDKEVSEDHNWGASLVEGASAISLALLINASF